MTFPPGFTFPKEKTVTAHVAAKTIADLLPSRGAVVQAGGCAGLWPLALAHYFPRVYTFEPEPANFACLKANIAEAPQIVAVQAALGDTVRRVGLTRPRPKAGLWHVEGDGDIPMVPLDSVVGDTPIDALVLDVEGYEVPALRGAERILAAHHPLLWLEWTTNTADLTAFLEAHGYGSRQRGVGGDCYSVHASRVAA